MSLVPESGGPSSGFDDIIAGITLTAPKPAPMDGELVYIDSMLGEESRRHLELFCGQILGQMVNTNDGLEDRQVDHANTVLNKAMNKGELPFAPNQLLAVGGAGVFFAYDLEAELEMDEQTVVLLGDHRLFGHFTEVMYNQYPVSYGVGELPSDYEGSVNIDSLAEGFVVCLDDVIVCDAEDAGLKIDSFDRALFPVSVSQLLFHTVYRQL
jgi:hypothetical protein